MSFLDTIFARLVAELVDGRAPILTPLARLLTSADEKDARIAVRLLTDQQLADALAERWHLPRFKRAGRAKATGGATPHGRAHILKPQTFMNSSGAVLSGLRAAGEASTRYSRALNWRASRRISRRIL